MVEADRTGELTSDELEVLAQAAWWVGQQDTARESWERAYTLHAGRDQDQDDQEPQRAHPRYIGRSAS